MTTKAMNKVTISYARMTTPDEYPDLSYLEQDYSDVADEAERAKYREQDRLRLEAYNRGDWACIGIRAQATIAIKRNGYTTTYTLKSPGLWGIESDADESYLREVFENECEALRQDILALRNKE